MKRLSWTLILALLVSMMVIMPASAEGTYSQAPMLDALVESGALAPVEERLPETPKLAHEILDEYLDMEPGKYGGTVRLASITPNWDGDAFIGMNEGLLSMSSTNSGEILPNVVESYEVNEDSSAFTFKLRKGLKWSDGVEVTMEDVKFGIENFVFNEELCPVVEAWMRDGGSVTGEPMKFEVLDDLTFRISFNAPYGGFLVHAAVADWKGYTDMIKPAHYLKKFHKDFAEECHGSLDAYYEFMQPFATIIGYDDVTADSNWTYVFNQVDMTNWELVDTNSALTTMMFPGLVETNFPHLYPWGMTKSEGGITVWERNPYYFKVDEDGQQLPYFDYITSTLVEDPEMLQMHYMSGNADFGREGATIDNVSLYRENEATSGMTAYTTASHVVSLAYFLNLNYGMNTDGTVKDDDVSKAWQECVHNPLFVKAIQLAIDAEEILDTVYSGFGAVNPVYECTGDADAANDLLDEMGMLDIDGDGWRETPSGLPFNMTFWNSSEASDYVPNTEFWVEYMTSIGLKFGVNISDPSNIRNAWPANEVTCCIFSCGSIGLWYDLGWNADNWAPLWSNWYKNGGLVGSEASAAYPEPNQIAKDYYAALDQMFVVDPSIAATELHEFQHKSMQQLGSVILPLVPIDQCVLVNSDIGNVPTGGIGIGWNYSIEQMFYNNPDQH